jgi:hypothetical protein
MLLITTTSLPPPLVTAAATTTSATTTTTIITTPHVYLHALAHSGDYACFHHELTRIISTAVTCTLQDAVDLLQRLLAFNPKKRITASEALSHAYVRPFRDRDTELSLSRSVRVAVEDAKRLSIKYYRTRLYREIQENLARLKASRSPQRAPAAPAASSEGAAPSARLRTLPGDAPQPGAFTPPSKPADIEPDASSFAAMSIGDRQHNASRVAGQRHAVAAAATGAAQPAVPSPQSTRVTNVVDSRAAFARQHQPPAPAVSSRGASGLRGSMGNAPAAAFARAEDSIMGGGGRDARKPSEAHAAASFATADDDTSPPVRAVATTAVQDDEPMLDVYGRR